MILNKINLTTGPVAVTPEVMKAFSQQPISHRSIAFNSIFKNTTAQLCEAFNVKQVYLLSGSGTLANEVMLQQIKATGEKGLILSNGEFGERLITQCRQIEIEHVVYKQSWGASFNLEAIAALLQDEKPGWVLFCHCETSTGVMNDLTSLTKLCNKYNCACFADCISSIGHGILDLSGVAMATGSSGKGLASIPGLGILFTNTQVATDVRMPVYFDLGYYESKNGVPFTISSNLLNALRMAISQKFSTQQFSLTRYYNQLFFDQLKAYSLIPFSAKAGPVYSLVYNNSKYLETVKRLEQEKVMVSYESDYLKKRNWFQLATFGFYYESQLKNAYTVLGAELKKQVT